jgi:hypothetical protein
MDPPRSGPSAENFAMVARVEGAPRGDVCRRAVDPPSNGRNRCSAEVVCLVPRTAVQARYVRGLKFARLLVACRVGCLKLTVYIQAFIQRPSFSGLQLRIE